MRWLLFAVLACASSSAMARGLDFRAKLNSQEARAVSDLLNGEPGFQLSRIHIAKIPLNDDGLPDLVILLKPPARCAVERCECYVLISRGNSGGAANFQFAFSDSVSTVDWGPVARSLRIDGEVRRWDGKTFRKIAI